jgi:hypothetical protein
MCVCVHVCMCVCAHVCACVCMCVHVCARACMGHSAGAACSTAQACAKHPPPAPTRACARVLLCLYVCACVCVCRVAGAEPESLSLSLSLRVPGAEPDAAQDGAAAPREELLTAGRRTSRSCYPLAARRYSPPAGVPAGAIARLLVCVCVCVCVRARARVCVCVVCGRVVDDGGRVLAAAGSGPLQ